MIGSWPTHAEKRGEKDIFVEQELIISSRRRPITDLFPLYCIVLLSSKNQFSHFLSKWSPILIISFHWMLCLCMKVSLIYFQLSIAIPYICSFYDKISPKIPCVKPYVSVHRRRQVDQDPIFLSPGRGPKQTNFRKIGSCSALQQTLETTKTKEP